MQKPVEKNKEYIVDIIDYGAEGEGIAKIENYTIFIPGALKGEKVTILIVKTLTSYAYGKLLKVLEQGKHRQQSDCDTFGRCGGCDLRHINYEETLEMKQQKVQNLVNKTLTKKIQVEKTLGMGFPYYYRNKAQYPFGKNKEGIPVTGIYAKRSHQIIPIKECEIQSVLSQRIVSFILDKIKEYEIPVYDETTQKGIVRHVVVRIGKNSGEVMCTIVVNQEEVPKEKQLVQALRKEFPMITTIVKNINHKNTNVIMGDKNITLYGNGYIFDQLGNYTFKISPLSFYQVNPVQAEALYYMAMEMAELMEKKEQVAFDLYCGIGTISLFLSPYFEKVYGIEIIPEAIADAKENAILNQVTNTEFLVGDVEFALEELIEKRKIKADIVVVDPPRKGLDDKTITNLIKIQPRKIIYISCNPATMVRDLAKLEEKYIIKKMRPVDMFPYTSHVECVTMLCLK